MKTTKRKPTRRKPANLFDLAFRRLVHTSARAVVCFINGLFDSHHPLDSKVTYPNPVSVSRKMRERRSDVVIRINHTHDYLVEAQIKDDPNMAVRIFEYVLLDGLARKQARGSHVIKMTLPNAKVIYLEHTAQTPDKMVLRLRYPGGQVEYEVGTLKLLDLSMAELEQRKLFILLPFCMLKLRREVAKATPNHRAAFAEPLRQLVDELLSVMERSEEQGYIDAEASDEILQHITNLTDELYEEQYKELKNTVTMAQERYIGRYEKMLPQSTREGKLEVAANFIRDGFPLDKLAKSMGLSLKTLEKL
jgi:hypothetical protein